MLNKDNKELLEQKIMVSFHDKIAYPFMVKYIGSNMLKHRMSQTTYPQF